MNIKRKPLLSVAFIAGVLFIGLYGVDSSEGYITVSELLSEPQVYSGQNVNVRGVIGNESLVEVPWHDII